MMWYDTVWYGMACYGMDWYGMARYGAKRYGIIGDDSPVLSTLGGSVYGQLVDGHGVHGGHEAFHDAEVVVQHLAAAAVHII